MATESFSDSYSPHRQVRVRRDYLVFQREEQDIEEEEVCSGSSGASAFTILNFILSSISLAANAVSNTNSNSNNNNNNNNDNNNNDNNVNVANNNNLEGNVNQVMFLPAIGRRRRKRRSTTDDTDIRTFRGGSKSIPDRSAAHSRLAIAAMRTFVELEGCGSSSSCRAAVICAQWKSGESDPIAQHLFEGSVRYFNLSSIQC